MDGYGNAAKPLWPLQPDMIFLNHGSYGAAPKRVLEFQNGIRDRLEAQPCQFVNVFAPAEIRRAAAATAEFLSVDPKDLVFVENTTTGINAILNALEFHEGEEILVVDHIYNAVRQTLSHVLEATGASMRVVPLGLPVKDDAQILAAIRSCMTEKTVLAIVDHVASVSGIVFPVAEIAALCRANSVPVLIDGAHAPGMLDLDISSLGVDWYVGNCHKWLCAPKGVAILWARPDRQSRLHPTVISHDFGKGFTAEFDKIGTRDQSAWLSIPEALRFHLELGGAELRKRNHAVVVAAAQALAHRFDTVTGAPAAMFGSMATVRLPDGLTPDRESADRLKTWLWESHRAEIHIMPFAGALWLRVSVQAYNDLDECLAVGPMVEQGIEHLSGRVER